MVISTAPGLTSTLRSMETGFPAGSVALALTTIVPGVSACRSAAGTPTCQLPLLSVNPW